MPLNDTKRIAKRIAVSSVARKNKWFAVPLLMVIGGAGALWGFLNIITQGMVAVQGIEPLLNERMYYIIAVCLLQLGLFTGALEALRQIGKQLILRDAVKLTIAMKKLAERCPDSDIRRLAEDILRLMEGRCEKDSLGEYELLSQLEHLDHHNPREQVKQLLTTYQAQLIESNRKEQDGNEIITSLRHLGLLGNMTSNSGDSETTFLLN